MYKQQMQRYQDYMPVYMMIHLYPEIRQEVSWGPTPMISTFTRPQIQMEHLIFIQIHLLLETQKFILIGQLHTKKFIWQMR
ncbi:hypothetical protein D3C87_1376330 [compost metagenome]